jgi:hypothetical protein
MAGPSKKLHVGYELLQHNEYSEVSESVYSSNSELNGKMSSCGEESVSSMLH